MYHKQQFECVCSTAALQYDTAVLHTVCMYTLPRLGSWRMADGANFGWPWQNVYVTNFNNSLSNVFFERQN
jgi:hypothetical protein